MSNYANTELDTFQEPTAERLAGLGAGCFVQIHRNAECEWVEITRSEGNEFVGMLHPALSSPLPTEAAPVTKKPYNQAQCQAANEELRLCKEQITALGCDRYCVC